MTFRSGLLVLPYGLAHVFIDLYSFLVILTQLVESFSAATLLLGGSSVEPKSES